MTQELKLSEMQAQGITSEMIDAFASERRDWLHRQVMVEQTKDHEDEMQRWANHPAPMGLPLVMACVDDQGKPDYVFIDDTQEVKEKDFVQEQDKLFSLVAQTAQVERFKVIPRGKDRLIQLHEFRIQASDAITAQKNIEEWVKEEYKYTQSELTAAVEAARDLADHAFMTDLKVIKDQLIAINWWEAEQHSEIADLTVNTIDAWKMAPYKAK